MKQALKIASISLMFTLGACTDSLKELDGKWKAAGDLGDGYSCYLEYTFSGSEYVFDGYPPIHEKGSIELLQKRNDTLEVQFTPDKNSEREPYTHQIIKTEKELIINDTRFYPSE